MKINETFQELKKVNDFLYIKSVKLKRNVETTIYPSICFIQTTYILAVVQEDVCI